LPSGDPVVVLKAQTGRSRNLALTQAVEVPPLEPGGAPGMGPMMNPEGGPMGSGPGGMGPFGY